MTIIFGKNHIFNPKIDLGNEYKISVHFSPIPFKKMCKLPIDDWFQLILNNRNTIKTFILNPGETLEFIVKDIISKNNDYHLYDILLPEGLPNAYIWTFDLIPEEWFSPISLAKVISLIDYKKKIEERKFFSNDKLE